MAIVIDYGIDGLCLILVSAGLLLSRKEGSWA
jgi:hypothetical protein